MFRTITAGADHAQTVLGGGYKSRLLRAFAIFFCTAVFSAVFFGSVDYIRSADAINSDVSVNINPVLSMRITKNNTDITELDLAIDPLPAGRFTKDDLTVLISTSNETGYTLTFSDKDTDTAMHHTDTAITATIPSITTNATEANFPTNSWGYSLEPKTISGSDNTAQTFSTIPANTATATIKTTSAPTNEDATDVTFAAKIDTTIAAGVYSDLVVFSATTNYVPRGIETITTMQGITPQICADSAIGAENTLTDTRDGKTYVVRRLADGRCWMVQNLSLGGTSPITLTPADSNVSANWVLDASSSSFGTTNDAAGINIKRINSTYQNAWVDENNAIQATGTPPSQTQYIGNYYNWYTATAGSGTYAMGTMGDNALQSICPKGWRLPTGGATADTEFQQLYDAYGSYSSFIMATTPVLSGYWYGSSNTYQGTRNFWWASTVSNATYGYGLYSDDSRIEPINSGYKRAGVSVRCVAEDKDITGITTMQQMTPSVCAVTNTPSATDTTVPENTLTDVRDGNTYLVRKLADGNCWMSQNLNLTLSTATALNSTTSDLSAGRTWTPQNNTQTVEGIAWAQYGGDVARSFEPGEAMYFADGVGTGTLNTDTANYSGYLTSGEPYWHVGNYYNWYAATAGSGTTTVTSGNATDSICPKGWKLPDDVGTKSFVNLLFTTYGLQDNDAASAIKILAAPLNFVRSGYYNYPQVQARVRTRGSNGYWWSNTATNALNVRNLGTSEKPFLSPQSDDHRGDGLSVRCVAR